MAPSSLKKMRGVPKGKEGNYASSKKESWDTSTNSDLELTFLPGSQILRKDERRSQVSAESSPKKLENKYVEEMGQWTSFETENRAKCSTGGMTSLDNVRSPSITPTFKSISPTILPTTARISRERPIPQDSNLKGVNKVVQNNADSAAAAPHDEQKSKTNEHKNAKSFQRGDCPCCPMGKKRPRGHSFNGRQRSKIAEGEQEACKTQYCPSHMHSDQSLSDISAVNSGIEEESGAIIRLPSSRSGRATRPSESVLHRQARCSPHVDRTYSRQSALSGSKDSAFHDSASTLHASALRSPAKNPNSVVGKLTIPDDSLKFQEVSKQYSKHPPVDIQTQALKGVKRSWTNHFPVKARLRQIKTSAPSSLAAPFTRNEEHEYRPISAPLAPTNNLSRPSFWSIHPSPSSLKHPNLSKSFDYRLQFRLLEDSLESDCAGKQRQSALRRPASMPNLRAKCTRMSMDSCNNLEPNSLPTPPHEQLSFPAYLPYPGSVPPYEDGPLSQNLFSSSRYHLDRPLNADNFPLENCRMGSNFRLQHKNNLSEGQSTASTSCLHLYQLPKQPYISQSVSNDDFDAPAGLQFVHRWLEAKPNYTHEEMQCLTIKFVEQTKTLKAENTSLKAAEIALKKGVAKLRQETAMDNQKIQHYERTIAQKDHLIETMQQEGNSLQRHYQQVLNEYHLLIASLRKENGTGNPGAIARKILWTHTPSATGATSQGTAYSVNASPVHCANGNQSASLKSKMKQASIGLHEPFQPVSVPMFPGTDEIDTSSRSLYQQGYATWRSIHANPPQMAPDPAYSETNIAQYPSRASVQQGSAATNHNSATSGHEQSTRWVRSNQALGTVGNTAGCVQNNNHPGVETLTERVTIDLTDDSQPPSSSHSCDILVPKTFPSVQCRNSPFNPAIGGLSPAHFPAGRFTSNQFPPGLSIQDQLSQIQIQPNEDSPPTNLEAMQVQREYLTRMAEKSFSWLQGENPFRKGVEVEQRSKLPTPRKPSQSNVEEQGRIADYMELDSIAPLPESAVNRKVKKAEKSKVSLTAEAKRERAKVYRKTAADKKKREKEAAEQSLQDQTMCDNAKRAQEQNRRAIKIGKRRQQAENTLEEAGYLEAEKILRVSPFREDTSVQEAGPRSSIEQAALDDDNSLFGEDEDNQMELEESMALLEADRIMHHDDDAITEESVAAYVAEVEAMFAAEEDFGTGTVDEQGPAPTHEKIVSAVPLGCEKDQNNFSCSSEESEEE